MLVEILSRMQFGFSIGFHILFPTLNIGLAVFLCLMEGSWLKTKNPVYLTISKFWTKIFALTFGMGVVSGIVLAYQIGTNFGPFIASFGNVLGALFAYETLTAFFLEAGFLGIMLFGWKTVPPKLHFTATFLVAIGTIISAFWILSANSWMQTPSGFSIQNGEYIVKDWSAVVFNPSFIVRFLHMIFASFSTTCFVIAGVASYFLLKNRQDIAAKTTLSFVMWAALLIVPTQILIGDLVGIMIHKYQPIKTAAIEGLWETRKGAPFVVFGLPSKEKQKNEYEISIPKLASLLNTHDWNGEMRGLNSVPLEQQPPVLPVFISFRIMVGIGLLMLTTAILALFLRRNGKLYNSRYFHSLCMVTAPMGFLASITGWLTAELGRQPWVVYNLLLTKHSVSSILPQEVFISMVLLILAYGVVFGFYIYYLFKIIRQTSTASGTEEPDHLPFQYMAETQGEKS